MLYIASESHRKRRPRSFLQGMFMTKNVTWLMDLPLLGTCAIKASSGALVTFLRTSLSTATLAQTPSPVLSKAYSSPLVSPWLTGCFIIVTSATLTHTGHTRAHVARIKSKSAWVLNIQIFVVSFDAFWLSASNTPTRLDSHQHRIVQNALGSWVTKSNSCLSACFKFQVWWYSDS